MDFFMAAAAERAAREPPRCRSDDPGRYRWPAALAVGPGAWAGSDDVPRLHVARPAVRSGIMFRVPLARGGGTVFKAMALNQFKAANRIELVVRAGVCSEPARCGASGTETAPLGAKAGAGRPR